MDNDLDIKHKYVHLNSLKKHFNFKENNNIYSNNRNSLFKSYNNNLFSRNKKLKNNNSNSDTKSKTSLRFFSYSHKRIFSSDLEKSPPPLYNLNDNSVKKLVYYKISKNLPNSIINSNSYIFNKRGFNKDYSTNIKLIKLTPIPLIKVNKPLMLKNKIQDFSQELIDKYSYLHNNNINNIQKFKNIKNTFVKSNISSQKKLNKKIDFYEKRISLIKMLSNKNNNNLNPKNIEIYMDEINDVINENDNDLLKYRKLIKKVLLNDINTIENNDKNKKNKLFFNFEDKINYFYDVCLFPHIKNSFYTKKLCFKNLEEIDNYRNNNLLSKYIVNSLTRQRLKNRFKERKNIFFILKDNLEKLEKKIEEKKKQQNDKDLNDKFITEDFFSKIIYYKGVKFANQKEKNFIEKSKFQEYIKKIKKHKH